MISTKTNRTPDRLAWPTRSHRAALPVARKLPRLRDKTAARPRKSAATPKGQVWEDLFSLLTLCLLAGAVLAGMTVAAREVSAQLTQANSFDLLRMFARMP